MKRELLDFGDYSHIFMKTRAEFTIDNKISNSNFTKDVDNFMDNLGIDSDTIRACDGLNSYQIPLLLEPIISIIMKDCKANPIYKKNKKISIDDIIKYNEKINKKIDKLPDDLKYEIKQTSSYDYNYKLNILSDMLVERLDLLFKLVISESEIESGKGIIQLIKQIDDWIIILKEEQLKKDMAKDIFMNINNEFGFNSYNDIHYNTQDGTNTLIESALKSCYNNQIGLTKLAREKFKNYGTKLVDKKMSRQDIINWIFYDGDLEPENISRDRKQRYSEIDLRYKKIRKNYEPLKFENRLRANKNRLKEIRLPYLKSIEACIRKCLDEVKHHNLDILLNNEHAIREYIKYLIKNNKVVRLDI